ncbi:MAG: TonB-dependent receptor [Saprospiraceae bacterium]|nr:TonB-dependent receptor [Saprospiraceae bacterium]
MNFKILCSLILFAGISFYAGAQGQQLRGMVIGAKDQLPLPGAHVSLIRLPDSTKTVTTSDPEGRFSFADVAQGNYTVHVTYLGFRDVYKNIEVGTQPTRIGRIAMEEGAALLGEVQVTERALPSMQKGDTTQFNANAFKTNPDASAEDLVQKMPGVTVQDGKVQTQGEDVKQVLVDGKPFFGNDPNAVLRNLPAEIVDKIQVFDQQSDQARFSGIDDGNTSKTINIITRGGGIRNGTFGRVYAGYGDQERYKAGGAINFFNGDRRISIVAQSNNINEQNFSAEDLVGIAQGSGGGGGGLRGGGGPPRGGGGGGNFGGGRPGGVGGGTSDFLVPQSGGISKTHSIGLNYTDKWGEKTEVSGSYFFNRGDNSSDQVVFRQYAFPPGGGQTYDETNLTSSLNTNHRLNFRLEYKIDSANSILFTPRVSLQQNDGIRNISGETRLASTLLNSTGSNFNSDLNGLSASGDLLYRHRFAKAGRTISINFGSAYTENTGGSSLFSGNNFFTDPISFDSLNQLSDLDKTGLTLSTNVTYTEPLGKKGSLQFGYQASLANSDSDKETFNYSEVTDAYDLRDTLLSNVFKSSYLTQSLDAGYRFNSEKSSFNIRLAYQRADLQNDQTFPFESKVERTFYNFVPSASYRYNFTKTKNLRVFYNARSNAPSVSQLQDVLDNTNPLQLSSGNPDLVQDFRHMLSARYSATNTEKSTSFFALLSGTYTQDYIGNNTFIAERDTVIGEGIALQQGAQFSQPTNLDGYYNLRSFITYGVPLKAIKSNFNLNLSGNYSRTPGLINGEENISSTPSFGLGLVISSNISDKLDFTISTNSSYNIVRNSLREDLNSEYFSQNSRLRFNWIFWKGFVYQTELSHQLNSGLSEGFNQNYLLWNMSIGKKLFKKQEGEIRLSVFDALSENISVQRNITEVYFEDVQTEVLQRYFMLSFIYNLRKF